MNLPIEIEIQNAVASKFPSIVVAAFRVAGIQNISLSETSKSAVEEAAASIAPRNFDIELLATTEPFASWRRAYGLAGFQPAKTRSSVEALVRRVLRGGAELATGLDVVDIYNAMSVAYLAPLGAYDISKLPSPRISLRFAVPSADKFDPLGGLSQNFPLNERNVVYASGDDVLCYGFNHRDSAKTGVSNTTDQSLFCGEATTPETAENLIAAISALKKILTENDVQAGEIVVVDSTHPSAAVAPISSFNLSKPASSPLTSS